MHLTDEDKELLTWYMLKGFPDFVVNEMVKRYPSKTLEYFHVQKMLNLPTVTIKFPGNDTQWRGPGKINQPWKDGILKIAQNVNARFKDTSLSLAKLYKEFLLHANEKISWESISWLYSPIIDLSKTQLSLGSSVVVRGKTSSGSIIRYSRDAVMYHGFNQQRVFINSDKILFDEIGKYYANRHRKLS